MSFKSALDQLHRVNQVLLASEIGIEEFLDQSLKSNASLAFQQELVRALEGLTKDDVDAWNARLADEPSLELDSIVPDVVISALSADRSKWDDPGVRCFDSSGQLVEHRRITVDRDPGDEDAEACKGVAGAA